MKDLDTRIAILRLHAERHGSRTIAEDLGVSRGTVKRVIKAGKAEVPVRVRPSIAAPHEAAIRALHEQCKGNLVRVHEELGASGVVLSYQALTGFCRRHGLFQTPKERAGHYDFEPGQEMQHDTSPHDVPIGERKRRVHCASLVLCYSTMLFAQVFPTWNRFWAKVFLTEAVRFFGGAAGDCMVDNSSVIVVAGTGKNAVMAPEVVALGARFGYRFIAHALGHANRSARVERPFRYIENNFYPGRSFADVADLNTQLRAWCERVNGKHKRTIKARPIELFSTERGHLKPLPRHIPEVYALWRRTVDEEGYVHLHTNRYSVPETLRDHEVSVHESRDRVRIFKGNTAQELVCEHERQEDGAGKRVTLPGHEKQARWRPKGTPRPLSAEERSMVAASTVMADMVAALQKRHGGRVTRPLGRLHRMWLDYPQEPLDAALRVALDHGLFDLERIEALVLRHVAGSYFRLPQGDEDDIDLSTRLP
jgi:transposase